MDAVTLTPRDVEQIVIRYKNAKRESKRLQEKADPECRFEAGRAYALEGILRMLGIDEYTEMVYTEGICK